jgi:hypothetical protein
MIGDLVLYTFALVVGVLLGWSARDARATEPASRTVTSGRPDGVTITMPYYVVHWHREDDLYVATVPALHGGAVDVDRYDDLHDAVHDMVATLTGSDRFWLEWRADD